MFWIDTSVLTCCLSRAMQESCSLWTAAFQRLNTTRAVPQLPRWNKYQRHLKWPLHKRLVSNLSLHLCFLVLRFPNCFQLHYQDLTFTFAGINFGLQQLFVFQLSSGQSDNLKMLFFSLIQQIYFLKRVFKMEDTKLRAVDRLRVKEEQPRRTQDGEPTDR